MTIYISDIHIPELDIYTRLNENQLARIYEPDIGIFICESSAVIERALEAGYEPESLLVEDKYLNAAGDILARFQDIPVYTSDINVLKQITGYALTRGVLCAMKRKAVPAPEEICSDAKRIAVLENITNPTNIGAILRSAAALYIDAVLLTYDCCDPLYRRSARVSMGTVFQVPWAFFGKEDDYMDKLKRMGFKTAAMALSDNSTALDSKELKNADRLAVIMGSEGYGLMPDTVERADYVVKIPMSHNVDSLNVAAASAVAFWELRRV